MEHTGQAGNGLPASFDQFAEVWCLDFEFTAAPGEQQVPLCLVAWELHSGRRLRQWLEGRSPSAPPFDLGPDRLFVAYYSSAEWQCHLALGWPLPANVLDLYVEFRASLNGLQPLAGWGLLGALQAQGLQAMDAAEKDELRTLAMRGGPYTAREREDLLDYCEQDVFALARLLPRMAPRIDLPRALLRGRYMMAAASMEHRGVPIDLPTLTRLRDNWESIQAALIAEIDQDYGVFDGRTFKTDRFEAWLARTGTPWPRLATGKLDLQDDTFREMARAHPAIAPLRELRHALGQMRLADLAVGQDGRNRTLLSAFRARTGRNQPSNARFIFGPATWLRSLIKPGPGRGVAYIDWSQQEFGIAAALSGDEAMQAAYASGDPYLAFAIQAGAAPPDATKQTHKAVRDQFKACVLAVQYGMGEESLAARIDQPIAQARLLLEMHRRTYVTFWRWSDAAQDCAMLHGRLWTVYGWPLHVPPNPNARSLRNFPVQANGAEMLRLACILGMERGVPMVAPVHDAVLIEADLDELEAQVLTTQQVMLDASRAVLDGFELRTDAELIRYPDRYTDARGKTMWDRVIRLLPP